MKHGSVVVVGAGVAGLAAAGRLRAAGVDTVLIEAGSRPGGRAWTAPLRGEPFDHGASWLHDAARNPLAAMATPDDRLIDSDRDRTERVSIAGRPATAAEQAGYEAAWDSVDAVVAPALRGPDTTLRAALRPLRDDPWEPLVALWEGAIIAAADADRLGLQDWHRNRLHGSNAVPPEGVGAYVVRKLATAVRLDTAATAIRWDGPGVRVETPSGTLRAETAIVTVSTGVLAAGAIRFHPALPAAVEGAVAALPMGLLSKVVLPAAGPGRLHLVSDTLVVDRNGRMTFNAWPQGRAHLVGFLGGDLAWQAAAQPGAATALARAELTRALGGAALDQLGTHTLDTVWGHGPAVPRRLRLCRTRRRGRTGGAGGRLPRRAPAVRRRGDAHGRPGRHGGRRLPQRGGGGGPAAAAVQCSSCSRASRKSRNTATRLLFRSSSG